MSGRSSLAQRSGFSLLEVLISLAMLLGSLALLAQLSSVGRRHLERASDKATALRLCQNKMARLLAGIDPLENDAELPLLEDPNWQFRVIVLPTAVSGLSELQVGVRRHVNLQGMEAEPSGPWLTLQRWIPTPLDSISATNFPAATADFQRPPAASPRTP